MKREDVIDKVLDELIDLHLIPRFYSDIVRTRLEWVYTAGWENSLTDRDVNKKTVLQFTVAGERVAEYPSATAAARKNDLTKHSISKACLGKIRTAGGYLWRYK